MQKSGFFNAILQNGVYDRKYNANDYSDNLAVVISNGVLRSVNDDLKVTANGMAVNVGVGRAWINGHYYHNDTVYYFPAATAPTGGSRYDRVVLRLNNALSVRSITLVYVQGIAADSPVPPAPVRSGDIYDIVLADVYVGANATNVVVTDKRSDKSVCGWVYSTSGDGSFFTSLDNEFDEWFETVKDTVASVTLFKRYTWSTALTAASNSVAFNIPQYNPISTFIEVYVNGILENEGEDFTVENNIITFDGLLIAGTEVTVKCYKSLDGEGIMSVADEITELQNQMAAVQGNAKYVYVCTGLNDNVSLSQIAEAILTGTYTPANVTDAARAFLAGIGGTTALAALAADEQIGIDIVGKFGATTAYSGYGTSESPYKWLSLGLASTTSKKINFNFEKCSKINITCAASTTNYLIYGNDLNVRGLNIKASSSAVGCAIEAVRAYDNKGRITFENSRFEIATSGAVRIAQHGTYVNCYGNITSEGAAAYCFKPVPTGLIRIIGGEYLAYCMSIVGIGSAIFHTSASDTDATAMASDIHCPTVAKTGYMQTYLSVANAGTTYINGVVTRLTSQGDYNQIAGLINRSKS